MNEALEQFIRYKDKSWGFLSPEPGHNTGNGLMYTAYYSLFLFEADQDPQMNHIVRSEIDRVVKLYKDCWVPARGMKRHPGKWDQRQAPDDYFGVALHCKLFDQDLAAQIVHSLRHNFDFLNENKNDPNQYKIKSLMRMPQLKIMLQIAAGEKPSPLFSLPVYLGAMFWALKKRRRSADSFRKAWMMYHTALGVSPVLDMFLNLWHYLFMKKFKGGIGEADYFKPEHPVTTHYHGR